jgi:hypothetical protein
MGRVSERCCHRSLPSEPDVKVSLHPAQADAKPRRNGTGATTIIAPCHLYDTGLQPSGLAFTLGPVGLVSVRCLPEDAHMDKSTFICFSSNEGSTGFLVTTDPAGSQPACAAGLKPQPLSLRLQAGFCFLQRSSARHPINAPYGVVCLPEAGCRVYHVPRSTPEDLGPLSTPAGLRFASGDVSAPEPACVPFGSSLEQPLVACCL